MPVLDCAALDDAAGLAVLRRVLGQPRPAAAAGAPGPVLCGETPHPDPFRRAPIMRPAWTAASSLASTSRVSSRRPSSAARG
jgi:hypothetical protein